MSHVDLKTVIEFPVRAVTCNIILLDFFRFMHATLEHRNKKNVQYEHRLSY